MSTMNQYVSHRRGLGWVKWLVLTIVLAIIAYLLSPFAPFGTFWRPVAGSPTPHGLQMALFIILNVAEVLSFGLGVSFLIFGYPIVQNILPRARSLSTAAYLSIAWLLIGWWPHDSLHFHTGETNLGALLTIEYAFHVTLMIGGAILAYFFFQLARQHSEMNNKSMQ